MVSYKNSWRVDIKNPCSFKNELPIGPFAEEQQFHVPLEKNFRGVFADDGLVFLQRGVVAVAAPRRDLEADMQQLADTQLRSLGQTTRGCGCS